MLKDVLEEEGKTVFLLGNEAIARGALEAGVDVFACYPGTPSSEIGDTLSEVCKAIPGFMHMEYSTNEKVAFEVAMAASLAGKRGMCAMKHVGVNVASDAMFSFSYIGAKGGFVVVSADDPFMHSSQNEQDNRWYGMAAKIPVFEASSVQALKDITVTLFEISEMFELPVMLRTYTRLSHSRGLVRLGKIPETRLEKVNWEKNPRRHVILPAHARLLKKDLWKRLRRLEEFLRSWDFNWIDWGDDRRLGVIACGLGYCYAKEAAERLGLDLPILKLSSVYPPPMKLIEDFCSEVDKVIVVEEVDPFIELVVKTVSRDVYGKLSGHMPMDYEYGVHVVEKGIASVLGIKTSVDYDLFERRGRELSKTAPPRPPVLCPGCPHAATFYAIKRAVGDVCFPSDIGCYTLGINEPFRAVDICICMGASVGVSNGLSWVIKDRIVATIGDSTFLHAGIPALINAVYNGAKFVLIVLDNQTTGMTGHQPHPGVGITGCGGRGRAVKIEEIAKAVGIEFVEVVNPYNVSKTVETIKRAVEHDGVSVIVARQKCAIVRMREMRRRGVRVKPFQITEDCDSCLKCVREFMCPAITVENGRPRIVESMCTSCGVCAKICPNNAIKVKKMSE